MLHAILFAASHNSIFATAMSPHLGRRALRMFVCSTKQLGGLHPRGAGREARDKLSYLTTSLPEMLPT